MVYEKPHAKNVLKVLLVPTRPNESQGNLNNNEECAQIEGVVNLQRIFHQRRCNLELGNLLNE